MKNRFIFIAFILILFCILIRVGENQLSGQSVTSICARYVDGFGSNHGWHDVDKAEGTNDDDYAWKYLNSDLYGRLLKAYDFEGWVQTFPIESVLAQVALDVIDPNCPPDFISGDHTTDIEVRVYDGTNIIASKIQPITCVHVEEYTFFYVMLPAPIGGWTKEKVDSLQIWIGAKEKKDVYLNVRTIYLIIEP